MISLRISSVAVAVRRRAPVAAQGMNKLRDFPVARPEVVPHCETQWASSMAKRDIKSGRQGLEFGDFQSFRGHVTSLKRSCPACSSLRPTSALRSELLIKVAGMPEAVMPSTWSFISAINGK